MRSPLAILRRVTQPPSPQASHPQPATVMAVGTSLVAVLAAVALATRFAQPAYVMPIWVVVVAGVCVVPTVIGGVVGAQRGRVTAWVAPAVAACVAVASLELLIFIIPILIVLVLFLLIFLGSPVVACTTSGEANSAPLWTWLASGGGMTDSVSGSSASSSDSSVSTGTETIGATKYSWVCDGSTVVHFTTHR
jgi:hypothetical protein